MDKSRIKILVVDDERGLCAGIQEALKREGYIIDAANDAATALKMISEQLIYICCVAIAFLVQII